jgi:putative NADPH-quinone reductase
MVTITKNDIIVMLFPFHCYSSQSLMEAWIDKVFSFGFAMAPTETS